jgi:hypothetical protein
VKTLRNRKFWIHPILLGLYPVLALYVFNRNEIVFPAIQSALITAVVISILVMAIFLLIFRSWQKAALHVSWVLLLFFSYGHIFDLVKGITIGDIALGHRVTLPAWILLLIGGEILIFRLKNSDSLNRSLDSITLILMILLSVQVLGDSVQAKIAESEFSQKTTPEQQSVSKASDGRDVYYIIVDSYSRADLLKEGVNLDISGFTSELESLGFYIPDCAQSNYDKTLQSLSSSLNMDYLEPLGLTYTASKAVFRPYIQKNLVMEKFKNMGYSIATFRSLYPGIDRKDVTYYYDYFKNASGLDSQAALNFQYLFLRTTLLRPLVQFIESNQDIKIPSYLVTWLPVENLVDNSDYRQYQQNVYALDSLQNIPELPGKKFVYAHLFVTHQPFVFYPDGSFHPSLSQDYDAYRDQVIFANKRLLEVVKSILANSDPKPIIVIQGDHSYFSGPNRVKILNAYYFPDGGDEVLFPTVTPVNTFRLIFNTYFGENYKLLPDVSKYGYGEKSVQEAPSTCENSR